VHKLLGLLLSLLLVLGSFSMVHHRCTTKVGGFMLLFTMCCEFTVGGLFKFLQSLCCMSTRRGVVFPDSLARRVEQFAESNGLSFSQAVVRLSRSTLGAIPMMIMMLQIFLLTLVWAT